MGVQRVVQNLFCPSNESLKNLQKNPALDMKEFFLLMGVVVAIDHDHSFQAKQAKSHCNLSV